MRIVGKELIDGFCSEKDKTIRHKAFDKWRMKVEAAVWKKPHEIKVSFANHVDPFKAESGTEYVIFDIGGNKYRLIARLMYPIGTMTVVRVMTHDDYDQGRWKRGL